MYITGRCGKCTSLVSYTATFAPQATPIIDALESRAASEMAGLRRMVEGMRHEMQSLEDELLQLRDERAQLDMERAGAADEADAAAAALAAAERRQADLVAAVDEVRLHKPVSVPVPKGVPSLQAHLQGAHSHTAQPRSHLASAFVGRHLRDTSTSLACSTSSPAWHVQAREALRGAAKEKSSALAAALEARDAARMKATVGEERAARATEDLERYLAAARQRESTAEVAHCCSLSHLCTTICARSIACESREGCSSRRCPDWRAVHARTYQK